ncbi:putative ran bp2 nzf zinc finger-like protein [Erysiphe neolycopersici]|uniref:Putative ran bp2 nzf zinc finger-like protein n=1 Tax=Erysiphe neolycopersici TaxID=212602 RepID=A0A420HTT3_9PEZI|nr:putative ran bp2 nzf zinc finger-like protein [Erysiphe neolycopersici]
MSGTGLDQSIWARCPNRTTFHLCGDWTCSSCRTRNYYWQEKCVKCCNSRHEIKQFLTATTSSKAKDQYSPAVKQPISSSICFAANNRAISKVDLTSVSFHNLEQSYWAPRHDKLDSLHKLIPRTLEPSTSKNSLSEPNLPRKKIESNLPYQVQHYILKLMERMLEEACYEFALRWIPRKLSEIECDCAEALELARWKSILPSEVPQHAFNSEARHSIFSSLADAVYIRNAAAHRHRCDNHVICNMARQGAKLMTILSDNTRQEKFIHLRAAIIEWENNFKDLSTARANLECALQKIAEQPINDMDWTPDSVSMDETSYETSLLDPTDHIDMMDLDYF